MKRFFALILTLALLTGTLAACRKDETPEQPTELPPLEELSDKTASQIVNSLAPDAKTLNASASGNEVILKERTTADDIVKAFTDAGYYNYPITGVSGANLKTSLLIGKSSIVAVYFLESRKEVRISWDSTAGFDQTALKPNSETDTGTLLFAQVGVERVDETDNPLNGLIYVLKLSDGRAMIVDGGFSNAKNAENIYKTLEKLEIKKDDEGKPIVAAWIITHAHSDHIGGVTAFIKTYGSKVTVEAFLYNFATSSDTSKLATDFTGAVRSAYPNAARYIAHANMNYYFGNVTVSMLYTPELIYQADSSLYFNDSSLVFRIRVGNSSAFVMGDAGNAACGVISDLYEESALKSNLLQITHHGLFTEANSGHGWGKVRSVYNAVAPDMAIMSMHAQYDKEDRNGRFTVMKQWADSGHQISYVMDEYNSLGSTKITQEVWDEFEISGTVNGVKVDTIYGYDGKNTVKNEKGLVTYLGGSRTSPMITIFTLDGTGISMTLNTELYTWQASAS